jgi:hypothetical protein
MAIIDFKLQKKQKRSDKSWNYEKMLVEVDIRGVLKKQGFSLFKWHWQMTV